MNKTVLVLLLSSCLVSCTKSSDKLYQTNMDSFTSNKVSEILREKVASDGRGGHGELVDSVSSAFLSTPYQANTLIGSPDTNEVLVADFNGVDCFTLLDYVEALTRSKNKEMFLKQLVAIRYAHANVEYFSRKHFFTDWFAIPPYNAVDVTHSISPEFISVQKSLNGKADGGEYISGLGIISRTINYVPGHAINAAVLDNLRTGDYVGVYSKLAGLDVSHTGIIIKSKGQVWLRNASSLSKNMRVVDTPFVQYMYSKPGFIVIRAK